MAVVTQTIQDQVTELYLGFFGRAPDAAGFGYWTNAIANGGATVQSVANGFAQTPEFVSNYGGLTPVQQVTKIYLNVLNRAPDAGGLTYWTGLLTSGSSIGSVVYGITNAAFAQTGTADGLLVQNKVKVGEYFAITLASNDTALAATAYNLVTSAPSSVVAAEAAITQGSGGTWALTTNIDTLVHGPFANFVGTVTGGATQTLNAGDTITGVGAGNVLKVVDTGNVVGPLAGVALTGVQELQVQSANAVASTNNYNLATTTGVNKVTSINSTQTGVTFSGLAAGTVVEVAGVNSTANTTNFTYTTASSSPTINLNGGVVSQTIAATAGTATSAVINSFGGTNGTTAAGVAAADTITLTGGGATLTSLAVHATTNLRAILTAADFAATGAALVVDGAAGSVNLGNLGAYKTIDASGLAGGLTVNASTTLTSFSGGQGNDSLTNNAAGNAAIAATASIDAGAGVDTVSGSLINAGNAAVFKNFEQIGLAGQGAAALDVSLMTNSTITGATISGALGGASALSNLTETASGFNVIVSGSAGNNATLGFAAASVSGTADVLNYTFADTTGAAINAGTVTHQNIEIVNIASGGVAGSTNTVQITDNALKTITVTGANAASVTVTDQVGVAGTTATALTTVDASALTKAFTFVQQAHIAAGGFTGVTITGGTANDSITVVTGVNNAGTSGVANTVNLVSGGSDTIDVTGATLQFVSNSLAATNVVNSNAGDILHFAVPTGAFTAAAVNVAAATDLIGAVTLASAGLAAGAADWFQYGGNTYVFQNTAGLIGTLTAADTLVKLTGIHDLTGSTLVGGEVVLGG